jgi:hypothetical protein
MWRDRKFTGTQPAEQGTYTAINLPESFETANVRRLTSLGVDVANNITFAGQYVDENARIVGMQKLERIYLG